MSREQHMAWERKLIILLVSLYCISIPLDGLFTIPLLGGKIQLPEAIFLLLVSTTFILFFFRFSTFKKWLTEIKLIWLDKILLTYGILVFTSYLTSHHPNALGETVAVSYFLVLYAIIRLIKLRLYDVKWAIPLTLWIATTSVFFSLIMFYVFDNDYFVYQHEDYYLLGDQIRPNGWSKSSLMLSEYLCIGALLVIAFYDWQKQILLLILTAVALYFTKAKSVFVIGGVLMLFPMLAFQLPTFWKRLSQIIGIAFILFYLIFSHAFFFTQKENLHYSVGTCKSYELLNLYAVPTPYYHTKKAAINSFLEHPIKGIGGNTFIAQLPSFYERGLVDCKIYQSPHCTYTGALAELGIFGFLLILLGFYGLFRQCKILLKQRRIDRRYYYALVAILLFIALQAVTYDSMNIRHYWVMMAVFANFLIVQISSPTQNINS
ncbi:MAG: O-antigen ligase family protein [Bacteroidota bacterium]